MRPKLESEANLLRDKMRVAVPVEEPEKVAARREALLKVIERQVALAPGRVRQAESRRKLTQGLRSTAAAAALMLAVGAGMFVQSQHPAHHDSGVSSAHRGQANGQVQGTHVAQVTRSAQQGESLATSPGERQRLKLPGDTVVSVGERTGLRLIEAIPARQVMELDYGRVDVDVTPAQGAHARYVSVRTPHAVVEVKGTIFSVDVHAEGRKAAGPGSEEGKRLETTVSVQRGVVVVHSARGDLTLHAGDSWSSAERLLGATIPQGRAASAAAPSRAASHPSAPSAVSPRAAGSSQTPSSPQTLSSSTLAEENELFERAIVAAEAGNKHRALMLCDEFLEQYPRSPLRATVFAKRGQLQGN